MNDSQQRKTPWTKGKLVGQKAPFTQQQVWSIRMRLEAAGSPRNLALFNKDPPSGRASTGNSKLDSTVRYLGIEIDDALEISEQIDV
jgi:hypothetical protein